MEMSEDEKLLNMREARQYLNVGRSTIIRFMERGVLDGMKVGSTWRFRLGDVKALVRKMRAKGVG